MTKPDPKGHVDFLPDAARLLRWYERNARNLPWRVSPADRRRGVRPDPYRVWLSEIMAQQTTLAVVSDYYLRFIERWPRIQDLAAAPLDDVLRSWAGLGYYARARNLHRAARQVVESFDGVFPSTAGTLMQLAGVGPYTGAAIAAICFDERVSVVDGNVERVMARFLALEQPKGERGKIIRRVLDRTVPRRAGDFAQAMMDLGAMVCTPRSPACDRCPLQVACAGFASGTPERFPPRPKKSPLPERRGHAFVLQRADGAVFLRRRGETGLLARMSEVPGSPWQEQDFPPRFPAAGNWVEKGRVRHVFTHFRLELTVWHCTDCSRAGISDGWWSHAGDLASEALPGVFRKVLAQALDT